MNDSLAFGVIGLGKIGGNLAEQALELGMHVAGFDIAGIPDELQRDGFTALDDMQGFRDALEKPRIIFLYVPAGPIVDQVIDELAEHLDEGDIIVDGGNSYWGDSIRRHERLRERRLWFVDLGTSGGIEGAEEGACFMAGGERDSVQQVEPILKQLAVENGYVHAGPSGAGHFVKLVHNGIEFGMLQAIGEGMSLLEHYRTKRQPIDVAAVLNCWRHGSVIRSWLVELMERSYREERGMNPVLPYIEDTGEVNWLVSDAMDMEVAVPVIAQSVMQLFQSRDDEQNWARAVAMMRHEFGGHPFGEDESIARERREGRIGGFVKPPQPE